MSAALVAAVTSIIDSIIEVWSSIVTESTVLPYFVIGIAVSVVLVGIKIIKSVVWGA